MKSAFSDKAIQGRDSLISKKGTQEFFNAKSWRLRSPAGDVYVFKNLSWFVDNNKHLFNPSELLRNSNNYPVAFYMLGKLRPTRDNPIRQWHGWMWAD